MNINFKVINLMTPKEKAVEIYNTFEDWIIESDAYFIEAGAFNVSIEAVKLALEFCGGKDMNEEFDKTYYLIQVKDELIEMRNEFFKPQQ